MKGKYPVRDDLSRAAGLNLPVCIIIGRQDIIFYPLSVRLQELIPGAELHVISEAGHLVNYESPDIFNRWLMEFLQGIDS
jgi:pimeloyl-ACP methyl ester carboxylesterase